VGAGENNPPVIAVWERGDWPRGLWERRAEAALSICFFLKYISIQSFRGKLPVTNPSLSLFCIKHLPLKVELVADSLIYDKNVFLKKLNCARDSSNV
jgi:hypothetical protein